MVRYNDVVHNSFLIKLFSYRLMVRLSEIYRYSLCALVFSRVVGWFIRPTFVIVDVFIYGSPNP